MADMVKIVAAKHFYVVTAGMLASVQAHPHRAASMSVDSSSFKAGEILTFPLACHRPALFSDRVLLSLACFGYARQPFCARIGAVKSEHISDLTVQLNSFFQSIIPP